MINVIDRVPRYPNRVTLNPVSGQANTFDLVRADAPSVVGTPINKALLDQFRCAEVGTYTGTGTTTVNLSFGFVPDVVIITRGDTRPASLIAIRGATAASCFYTSNGTGSLIQTQTITWNGASITLTATSSQANQSGKTYYYIAIGGAN